MTSLTRLEIAFVWGCSLFFNLILSTGYGSVVGLFLYMLVGDVAFCQGAGFGVMFCTFWNCADWHYGVFERAFIKTKEECDERESA